MVRTQVVPEMVVYSLFNAWRSCWPKKFPFNNATNFPLKHTQYEGHAVHWVLGFILSVLNSLVELGINGCHRLAHPLSQDIASPTHCGHISIKTDLQVQWQQKSRSVWVRVWWEQQATGRRCTYAGQKCYASWLCVYCVHHTRWFKYNRDWFVCKQAALRSSCATLREWIPNLHPPSCSG